MLSYIILFWVLQELAAPTWCWVCFWISCGLGIAGKIIEIIVKAVAKNCME